MAISDNAGAEASRGEELRFDPARVRRVLIYRLGSLGDTMVALPSLHVVERAFPNARRVMLTNLPVHAKAPMASAVLEGSGLVHGYIDYPVGTRNPAELARVWLKIRRFRPEAMVYLAPPRGEAAIARDLRFFRMCGIRNVVGVPLGDLAESHFYEGSGLWEPEAQRLLRSVRLLGEADVEDRRWWDLRLTDAELKKADSLLAAMGDTPLIACGPGTKVQAKDWGQENWRLLLGRISAAFPDHALVFVGAREDAATSKYAAGDWRGRALNLCGELSPRETAAVLRHTELFLGPDSGPMHLAGAVGVPCAIAFSARGPAGKWYPAGDRHRIVYHAVDCRWCSLDVCIEQGRKCLTSISVDEMFAAAVEAWKNGRSGPTSSPAGQSGQPCTS